MPTSAGSPRTSGGAWDEKEAYGTVERASHYQLIGCPHSYYTGKVRAYMLYKGIAFEEVLSTMEVYAKVILPQTGVAFIPVLLVTDEANDTANDKTLPNKAIQDTSDIIDFLEVRHPSPSIHPSDPVLVVISSLLELLADEWLVLPAMHYRWSFPEQRHFLQTEWEALAGLYPGGPHRGPGKDESDAKKRVAASMSKFGGSLPFLGVTDTTIPLVEAQYLRFLDLLEIHLTRHVYVLGPSACLGDFALMGPLFAHLYRDPVPGFIMRTRAPVVTAWVERLNGQLLSKTMRCKPARFATRASLLPTLVPVLDILLTDFLPVLQSTVTHLTAYFTTEKPKLKLPRVIGMHQFSLSVTRPDGRVDRVQGTRAVFPYTVWMLQRVTDTIASQCSRPDAPHASADIDEFLGQLGRGRDLMGMDVEGCRVRRVRNVLQRDARATKANL